MGILTFFIKYLHSAIHMIFLNILMILIEKFKKQQKSSEITEDDYKIAEKDIQKLTDDYIKELDKIAEKKEKELLEI